MTSTIKVNNIQNQCGQNIINENSNTITIGASGDTIALASGASQTGFGRTGAVNWQTTKKTANFTATSGEGYFCDTAASGAFTLTLPSSPSAGDIVGLKDYNGNFATANLTIGRGGSNLSGTGADKVLDTNNLSLTLVYVDATEGWMPVEEGTGFIGENFISATGGTITTSGDFKVHTFTGPGTFTVCSLATVSANNTVDYLVVAGGGGGGQGDNSNHMGGAGGAGGFRVSNDTCMSAPQTSPLANPTGITVTATAFPITVGGGGAAAGGDNTKGSSGNPSSFSTIASAGGGNGGAKCNPCSVGGPGGSGGGGTSGGGGGSGNTPPVSPPQGNNGSTGFPGSNNGGGGGGGAGAASSSSPGPNVGAIGGAGSFVVQTGFAGCNGTPGPVSGARYFAGGGTGSSDSELQGGGDGGGGAGSRGNPVTNAGAGGTNTGGGGGGGTGNGPGTGLAGAGGSGIVIIRYKFQ